MSKRTFQGTGKTVTGILRGQLKGYRHDIDHIECSIFDLRIELKST